VTGPLGQTYGKGGRPELPAVREAWGDSWPRVVLGVLLLASAIASLIAAGCLRVVP
jgi:hypothetical protein